MFWRYSEKQVALAKMENLKERTARGLLWSGLNSLLTQLMNALVGVFLARLLLPEDYGMVGMLAIFIAIAASLYDSGFTAALTNLREATARDYNAVFWFSTGVTVSIYVLLFFCAPAIARFFRQPALVELSRLVFLTFVMSGMGTAHAAYMFRNMMNREKTVISLAALVVSSGVGITLAACGKGYWSLAWQQLLYITVTNMGRLYYVAWRPSLRVDLRPLRPMFAFGNKVLATNMLNQLNNHLLSAIFGRLYAPHDLGNFTQANKWNQMGYNLIMSTMQQVAQPVLASINDERERQLGAFRKMVRFTSMLSFPAMLTLSLIADEFIVLLLTDRWAASAALLRILCVGGAFVPLHLVYQNLFISRGQSAVYLWSTACQIAAQLACVVVFSRWGLYVMVCGYAALLVLWLGVWQMLAWRLAGLRLTDSLKDVCPFLLAAAFSVGVAHVVSQAVGVLVVSLLVKVAVSLLVYAAIMQVARVKIFAESLRYFLRLRPGHAAGKQTNEPEQTHKKP